LLPEFLGFSLVKPDVRPANIINPYRMTIIELSDQEPPLKIRDHVSPPVRKSLVLAGEKVPMLGRSRNPILDFLPLSP